MVGFVGIGDGEKHRVTVPAGVTLPEGAAARRALVEKAAVVAGRCLKDLGDQTYLQIAEDFQTNQAHEVAMECPPFSAPWRRELLRQLGSLMLGLGRSQQGDHAQLVAALRAREEACNSSALLLTLPVLHSSPSTPCRLSANDSVCVTASLAGARSLASKRLSS